MVETYELKFANVDIIIEKIYLTHNYPKYILKNDLTILWQKISKENQVQNNSINIIFSNN